MSTQRRIKSENIRNVLKKKNKNKNKKKTKKKLSNNDCNVTHESKDMESGNSRRR